MRDATPIPKKSKWNRTINNDLKKADADSKVCYYFSYIGRRFFNSESQNEEERAYRSFKITDDITDMMVGDSHAFIKLQSQEFLGIGSNQFGQLTD